MILDNIMGNDMNMEQHNLGSIRVENERNMRHDKMDKELAKRDAEKEKVLVGIFETENEAINVIRRLKETGYQENEITVLAKDKKQMEHIDDTTKVDTKTKSDNGKVGTGATVGAVLGGVAAAIPALGLLVIPGIGPLLAAGPVAAILGGVVAGGVAGGLVGVLAQLGVNEEDAKEYENHIEQGKILVLVENKANWREDVQTTFRQNNSINLGRNE